MGREWLGFLKISQFLCFFRFLANVLSALLNLHWGGSSASLMLTRMRYHEFYAVQRRLFRKLFVSEDSTPQVQNFRIPTQDAHHNVICMVLHDSQKEGNSLREGSPSGDASPWLSRSSAALKREDSTLQLQNFRVQTQSAQHNVICMVIIIVKRYNP